jgi:hypothetical protein
MDKEFKHPQIFADLLLLSQQYYPLHNNLPKPFRFSVGEQLLAELADCLRYVILANAVKETLKKTSRFWQNTRIPPAEFPHEADDLR